MTRWLPLVVLLLFVPLVGAQPPDEKKLDAIVAEALKTFDAPGAAVVVVHEDKVVYLKGAGVRELGNADPVTADTIFQIASCTKAFLAMLIALLTGDGLMDFDDPVHKHVPHFRLSDPLADQNITIRDTLCHRTGLSRHDLLWFKSPLEPDEVIRRIGHVKATSSFRSTWEYANIPFLTAGTAAAAADKRPLAESFKKRIFDPLGMKTASATATEFLKAENRAVGYRMEKGKLELIPPLTYDLRGAGDISASVRDLGQWLRFQLGDGTFNGKRLVPAKLFHETHAAQMVVKMTDAQKDAYPGVNQLSYALGWFVYDYQGHQMLSHGGSLPGFRTQTVIVPQAKLGVVCIGNRNPSFMTEAVAKTIVDRFLGLPDKDWNAYYVKLNDKQRLANAKKEASIKSKRVTDTKPTLALKSYAGVYEHPAYGKATIAADKDGLTIKWSSFDVSLQHWHYDTFRTIAPLEYVIENEFLVFNFEADATVRSFRWLGQEFTKPKAKAPAKKFPESKVTTPVPDEVIKKFKLDTGFYKKHLDYNGFSIISSAKVSDAGLYEARYLIDSLLGERQDILQAMIKAGCRFMVMAPDEMTTDVPEQRHMKNDKKTNWDLRARGLGGKLSSCGEENLLNLKGDRYRQENILIHEFNHAIHQHGLRIVDPTFNSRLKAAYDKAKAAGLWKGTYLMENHSEYWAEAAQAYFDCMRPQFGANTREKLQKYDPDLFKLVDEVYRQSPFRYVRYDKRKKVEAEAE